MQHKIEVLSYFVKLGVYQLHFYRKTFFLLALLAKGYSVRILLFGQMELDHPYLSLIMSLAKS